MILIIGLWMIGYALSFYALSSSFKWLVEDPDSFSEDDDLKDYLQSLNNDGVITLCLISSLLWPALLVIFVFYFIYFLIKRLNEPF